MGGVGPQQPGRLLQGEPLRHPRVEEFAQPAGEDGVTAHGRARHAHPPEPQVGAQPLADQRRPALGLQFASGSGWRRVHLPDTPPEHGSVMRTAQPVPRTAQTALTFASASAGPATGAVPWPDRRRMRAA